MPAGDGDRGTPAGDSFLRRWSRRKHAAERPAGEAAPVPREHHAEEERAPAVAEAVDQAAAQEAPDLPHPDTLPPDADFAAYLAERVPAHLRRAAMRRLFGSPEFNVRDGLDDYDDDYTSFQSLGETVTAHLRYHQERLRKREAERAAREEGAAGEPGADAADTPAAEEPAPADANRAADASPKDDPDTGPATPDDDATT